MKIILSSRRHHYLARVSIFLITVALIAGMVGCDDVKYDLTIASTAGGSTTPGEGTSTYDEGTDVNLEATPDAGYRFVKWMGDVATIANVNAASTTITMEGDYSIRANFEKIAEYDLTISSSAGGSVRIPGEGTFTRYAGTVVALEARADVGHGFVNWTGDVDTVADVNAGSTNITMNDHYSITANFEQQDPIPFADPNLAAAIREAIGITERPIYPSDLKGLTSLDADRRSITDLTGLERCTDLIELSLYMNQISDILRLANLTSLTSLDLWRNQIDDISPLANLTSLTDLSLGDNQIIDISPLASLTSLTSLGLGHNQISDISTSANLTSLTRLNLEGNKINDISPLANLRNLTYLSLYDNDNKIIDISPLANLTNLTSLNLEQNQISDISPLANLTSLTDLNLYDNQIINISLLADFTKLTHLSLGENKIIDILPLANLTSLMSLNLEQNKIIDISPLANLTSLIRLHLLGNQISDISPLVQNEGLGGGDKVYLSGNPLSSDSINIYIPKLQTRGVTVDY